MAHDVFVSYSAKDKSFADALCATLENRKIRCWVAPRDVLPGKNYAEALIEAINFTRIMVLVFSSSSNNSPHVMREVERAVNKGIPIIPLRVENVMPSKSMEYFLSVPHWLDAYTPPLEKHLQKLADIVQTLLAGKSTTDESQVICSGCGETMSSSLEYCSNCGKKLDKTALAESTPSKVSRPHESQVICAGCGEAMSSSLEYCSNCGKKLDK
jgi:ribosomal protein L37E